MDGLNRQCLLLRQFAQLRRRAVQIDAHDVGIGERLDVGVSPNYRAIFIASAPRPLTVPLATEFFWELHWSDPVGGSSAGNDLFDLESADTAVPGSRAALELH